MVYSLCSTKENNSYDLSKPIQIEKMQTSSEILSSKIYSQLIKEENEIYLQFLNSDFYQEFAQKDLVKTYFSKKEEHKIKCQELINSHIIFLKQAEKLYDIQSNIDNKIDDYDINQKIRLPIIFCEQWKNIINTFNLEYLKFDQKNQIFQKEQEKYDDLFQIAYQEYKDQLK